MKKSYFGFIMLLFLLTAGSPGLGVSAGQHPMNWKEHVSGQKEPFIKVVETSAEWNELWMRAFEKPAPAIDFEKYVVACVFLGHSADWLYSIHIDHPIRRGDVWVIPYELVKMILELAGPFKAGGQYHMQVFEKAKDVKMILEETGPPSRKR